MDRQIANYEVFNKEFQPQGLEVEFVNPGQAVTEKITTLHVAGTPADLWESPFLWRDQEGLLSELFQANGLKPPPQDPDDRSWTLDAFTELATHLTKGTTQFGWGGSYTPGNEWLNGATYHGYGPVDLPSKKITISARYV